MILDDGICSVFEKASVAEAGNMPVFRYIKKHVSWYKVLSFGTSPKYLQNIREYSTVSLKIRVKQNRAITNHDIVILRQADGVTRSDKQYEVIRAYHDADPDTVDPITDIDLEVVQP